MLDSVLLVEDDEDIARLLQVHLEELSLTVNHIADGLDALNMAKKKQHAIFMLDLMLPNMDGLSLCRELKSLYPMSSVIIVTSKSSEIDKIIGLEVGADDYICKPFNSRELQARVKAQLRHVRQLNDKSSIPTSSDDKIQVGALTIDTDCHEILLGDIKLELTATEFELLQFFAKHPNHVFSRSQLLESVWGYQHSGYEHTVNSHINRLRAKLDPISNHIVIETVWGVGYKLNASSLQGVNA
ncbi:DNA-binding response regulator [Pseudoalteromonas sp. J010]|uniref:response regulator transcription factor n=1 Tax=Pseudoalteromonas sp. J010 TaxID=998465 RepID=UPI000F64AF26|nr:response regulator transcription factor [Pseudoalteromonas sp. J010]RRS06501.1 DNA-binding response regulator [Pseudoalteromonas sp. J010]